MGWIAQPLPFQLSVTVPPLLMISVQYGGLKRLQPGGISRYSLQPPTVTQDVAAVQLMPSSPAEVAPVGIGTVWLDHALPFHLSTNVPPETAEQAFAAEQETRLSPTPEGGLMMDWIDHSVPFHASANGCSVPELSTYCPTAMHAVAVVHDTSFSTLLVAPAIVGVDCIDHAVPSQRSATPTFARELST